MQQSNWSALLKNIIYFGYFCLILSSVLLYLSISDFVESDDPYQLGSALLMMCARTAGIFTFLAGAIALFNKKWTHGSLLFIGSIGLPIVSVCTNGSF